MIPAKLIASGGSARRYQRYKSILNPNVSNLCKILIGLLLLTLIIPPIVGQDEEEGVGGGGGEGGGGGGGNGGGGEGGGGNGGGGEGGGGEGGGGGGGNGGGGNGGGGGDGGGKGGGGPANGAPGGGGAGGGGGGAPPNNGSTDNNTDSEESLSTTHELLGQAHYPLVELTGYKSDVKYSVARNQSIWPLKPVFNFTHWLFDRILDDRPLLPPGYVVIKKEDTLALGPKVEQNEWNVLLSRYWHIIIWVLLLIALIVILPFLAVCYCCFCCCRRCKMGCPPCDMKKDKRKTMIYGLVLLFLTILLLIFLFLAFMASRMLDRGFDDTSVTMRRGSDDTCKFLKDVADNIYHVFVYNYEELEGHLNKMLEDAPSHIFLDLGDTSESSAIAELERILDNMQEARVLIKQVNVLEKELRFYTTQLRDGVRGIKRDINYACSTLVSHSKCSDLLRNTALQFVDASNCLHLDKVPETTKFVKAIEKIIKDKNDEIPKRALERFQKIGQKIKDAMENVVPGLEKDIASGKDKFQAQSGRIRNIIDAVISDIHFRTLRSTRSFEDVYDKIGNDRTLINIFVLLFLFVLIIILFASLICGCFINRATGATCLLIAIILMFCIFSIILLVALFYFMMGVVTYQGACAPLRDKQDNEIFRQLDSVIDLNRYIPSEGGERSGYPPLRMSKAIDACMANESIFGLLQMNELFDVEDLTNIKIMSEDTDSDKSNTIFEEDLSNVVLLTEEEKKKLNEMRSGDLSGYHSIMYLENMCKQLTPSLTYLSSQIKEVRDSISYYGDGGNQWNQLGRYSLTNEAYHMDVYNLQWTDKIINIMDKMKEKLMKIDTLILYENRNFTNSIEVLIKAIVRSENFIKRRGKPFINSLANNLTDVVNDQIDVFINGVIRKCNKNIGHCRPLAYIYYTGVDLVCYRLVDPINALWLSILICALLLLPIIYVAHVLLCLFKRLHAYAAVAAVPFVPPVGGCPTCTGAPYVPPPIVTCEGGQQAFCVCSEAKKIRTDGGAITNEVDNATLEENKTEQKGAQKADRQQAGVSEVSGSSVSPSQDVGPANKKKANPTPARISKSKND